PPASGVDPTVPRIVYANGLTKDSGIVQNRTMTNKIRMQEFSQTPGMQVAGVPVRFILVGLCGWTFRSTPRVEFAGLCPRHRGPEERQRCRPVRKTKSGIREQTLSHLWT